jgi:hypothetical protein
VKRTGWNRPLRLALSYANGIEDTDFFGTGVAVWTSDRVEIFLRAQFKSIEENEL